MSPVKGKISPQANPVKERLLALAALIAPPDTKPNVAYLERRVRLTRGALKDAGRHASISKTLAAALVDAAPALGIQGLTLDWVMRGTGRGPHKGGEMPPGVPSGERSDSGAHREGRPVGVAEPKQLYPKTEIAAGIAAWRALEMEMQHHIVVQVIKGALEAQDFVGIPVLLALHGIAQKMQEMGYTAMARHIHAELGKYFGENLPPET